MNRWLRLLRTSPDLPTRTHPTRTHPTQVTRNQTPPFTTPRRGHRRARVCAVGVAGGYPGRWSLVAGLGSDNSDDRDRKALSCAEHRSHRSPVGGSGLGRPREKDAMQ